MKKRNKASTQSHKNLRVFVGKLTKQNMLKQLLQKQKLSEHAHK